MYAPRITRILALVFYPLAFLLVFASLGCEVDPDDDTPGKPIVPVPDDGNPSVDCEKTPDDPSCDDEEPVDCEKTPNDPSCDDEEPVDCEKTPNDPSCDGEEPVDCEKTPEDPSCTVVDCDETPDDPSCTVVDCDETPDDPSCDGQQGGGACFGHCDCAANEYCAAVGTCQLRVVNAGYYCCSRENACPVGEPCHIEGSKGEIGICGTD